MENNFGSSSLILITPGERERGKDKQTGRHRDRQRPVLPVIVCSRLLRRIDPSRGKATVRHTYRKREILKEKETNRHANRQSERETNHQINFYLS